MSPADIDRIIIAEAFQPVQDWQARLRQKSDHLPAVICLAASLCAVLLIDLRTMRTWVGVGTDIAIMGGIHFAAWLYLRAAERRAGRIRPGGFMGITWTVYRVVCCIAIPIWLGLYLRGGEPFRILDDALYLLALWFGGVELRDPPPPVSIAQPVPA